MGDEQKKDIFEKELEKANGACAKALMSNWDGILAAGVFEAI